MDRTFFIRNILNIAFIILALGAMVGVVVCKSRMGTNISYGVAVVAVIIKIIEVILRMPSMTKKTQYEQRRYNKRWYSGLQEADSAK